MSKEDIREEEIKFELIQMCILGSNDLAYFLLEAYQFSFQKCIYNNRDA